MRRLAAGINSHGWINASRSGLSVGDVMSREVVTVGADDTVFSAAKKMSENGVSCVVAFREAAIVGILTEKDILKGIAAQDVDFRRLTVSDRMSSPVEVVPGTTSVIDAGELMESKGIKRLPVIDDGTLAGIVTQTDITRGLVSLAPLRSVSKIMSRHVATVQAEATIHEAADMMATNGISCLVAMHRNQVAGILTEKDLLRRVVALHKDPTATHVADVMSFPIATVASSLSVLSAGRKMDQMHLHRLVVMEEGDVCGIVTQTDIMRAVRHQLETLEAERRVMSSELAALVQYIMNDLQKLKHFLNGLEGPAEAADRAAGRPECHAVEEPAPSEADSTCVL
jgi:predicted transcriptional regulator